MSAAGVTLQGFAFGEYVDGVPPRSLGYQLQAPVQPESWSTEVEALARQLQAASYPDHWPPAECFCSVLLGDGQRLVAVARYGQPDHTASRRRGGLELIGVIGPGELDVSSALSVYRWLRQRRAGQADLRSFGGHYSLADILASMPASSEGEIPEGAVRFGQEEPLLLAALAPTDPERHLKLLQGRSSEAWQWLPFVSPDFPLQDYVGRGPLVAWIPHVSTGVSRADLKPVKESQRSSRRSRLLAAVVGCIIVLLLAANLWAMLAARSVRPSADTLPVTRAPANLETTPPQPEPVASDSFAQALHQMLEKQQATKEWTQSQLLQEYQALVAQDDRLRANSMDGKMAIGAIGALSRRTAGRIERQIRDALSKKGYDEELINLACVRIRQRLAADVAGTP